MNAQRAINAINDLLSPAPRGRQAQRMRGSIELAIEGEDGESQRGRVDPSLVRLTSNPGGTAVIVAAPSHALPLIGSFISLIDQSPVTDRIAIRRYMLQHARAQEIAQPIAQLLEAQRRGQGRDDVPSARLVPDQRTNSLLVTATDQQHGEIERLLESLDEEVGDPELALNVFALQNIQPGTMRSVIDQIVVGRHTLWFIDAAGVAADAGDESAEPALAAE